MSASGILPALAAMGDANALRSLNGGVAVDDRVADHLANAKSTLRRNCTGIDFNESAPAKTKPQSAKSLYSRLYGLSWSKDVQEARQVQLLILQDPSFEPGAFDLWLTEKLWSAPIARSVVATHFERAYAEDGIYRAFVEDPPNSYRGIARCALQTKCRPELVVVAERKLAMDAFVAQVVTRIKTQQWDSLL